jgi:hypothetical protein
VRVHDAGRESGLDFLGCLTREQRTMRVLEQLEKWERYLSTKRTLGNQSNKCGARKQDWRRRLAIFLRQGLATVFASELSP